ncbi:MAG TPA: porin family protein [Ohtaekwangia sp.]|nr:porin family protein [Ohtaekwangia sp.]
MSKTKLLLSALLIGISAGSFAQAQLGIGIKGGVNFAKLDGTTTIGGNFKNRTGYHFGAFALVKLTKIGIQPEIIFSQQGSKVRINNEDVDGNFSYINIPVLLKLYTIAGINLQAGPQFGFLSRAEIDGENMKDSFKNSDISLALGAGWDLPFGLSIDARYNLGLSKIEEDFPEFKNIKNQVIQISLGYKLIKLGN